MSIKIRILLGILVSIIFLGVGVYFLIWHMNRDASLVTISTDRREYQVGDIVQISIRNQGDHSIDIYCPEFCALGNFPTRVERFKDGGWQYFAGFCPSIEPLFGSGVFKGDYVRHRLSARGSFELEISNFESLHLAQAETLRLVYLVGLGKKPVYSNEFTVGP